MANVKISELSLASTPLTGAEELPVVQSGVTYKTRVADVIVSKQDVLVSGTNIKSINSTSLLGSGDYKLPVSIQLAASDESTALTVGTSKLTFRMPHSMIVTGVRASLTTAQTSGSIFTVDINEGGVSILSTKLTIDNTEKTSVTAATPAVISDSNLTDDSEITIDIDQIGDGTAKGLKVTLIGTYA